MLIRVDVIGFQWANRVGYIISVESHFSIQRGHFSVQRGP
jgi:hypothetical protein